MTVSADQIVVLILLLALAVKFVLFENREDPLISSEKMATAGDPKDGTLYHAHGMCNVFTQSISYEN